eukprot:192753_1
MNNGYYNQGYYDQANDSGATMMNIMTYGLLAIVLTSIFVLCCCIGFGVGCGAYSIFSKKKTGTRRPSKTGRYQRLQQISVHQSDDDDDDDDADNNDEDIDDQ